jgi:two-component system response regulator QseB
MPERTLRLLLVDDDPYLRILVSMALPGIDMVEAARMDEALEVAAGTAFDALVLDRRLPDGDGLGVVRQLRKRRGVARDIPILVITSGHDEHQRQDVMTAGADEYLDKVTEVEDLADLAARVERLVAMSPGERGARRAGIVARLKAGEVGDLDPPTTTAPAPEEETSRRRRWRRGE